MRRIALMVIKNFYRLPFWFYRIVQMGKQEDHHTEQERYNYLRGIVKAVNRSGRVTLVVSGVENLPEQDGFVLFPNHQGFFDMLAIIESCPHHLSVVIKKEAVQWILVKQVIRLLRGLAIDRDDIKDSLKVIMQVTKEVKEGRNYVIFAEGTRSREGNKLLKFKGGTFKCAVNARCPIVPVALVDSFKPFNVPSIKKETVRVHFLEPIPYEQYMGLKTVEIADMVERRIQQKINENILEK